MRRIRNCLLSEPEIIWVGWGWWTSEEPRNFTMPRYCTATAIFTEAQARALRDGYEPIKCR